MNCSLYIRSVYSLLSSLCNIENIVAYGQKYGYKALALVDHNVLSGAMAFNKACLKNDIQPIFGLSVDLKIEEYTYEIVLYARDDEGFKNLMALSSLICTRDNKIINLEELNKYRNHNILCLLSDSMPLTYALDKKNDLNQALTKQNAIFNEYVVGLVDHDCAANVRRDAVLKEYLKEKGILTLAINRTFYLQRDDYREFKVLEGIRDKKMINDQSLIEQSGRHFLNQDEYRSLYDEEILNNNDYLLKNCHVHFNYHTSLPLYKNNKNVNSKEYLVSLCKEGLRRRLKDNVTKPYLERLNYELKVIIKMNFEDYFLIVYDFILFAKKNNILIGPGRGSSAGCLVAYCLGITDIDPLKYGLIFERFLNPERISMPDIDTDFPDDKRDLVIEYVKNKYGIDHVAHIITYGTLKAKQVLRDVARVLNYNAREVDNFVKLIPNSLDMSLANAYKEVPLFRQKIDIDPKFRELFMIAQKLEFNPRHESTHAAGIIMSKERLQDIVPLIKIEDDVYSSQYTMEYLEEFGLIKMDFLSIKNLSIIAEIVEDINRNQEFKLKDIDLVDKKTFDLIDNVNVLGVFQLESSGMRNLISQMKPRNFNEIGMCIALFRPGPMKNIPLFLENRAHPEKIVYLHENLKPILQETYGIIIYQEQIINIARVMAGFSYGKADILRKAMSKKKLEELVKLHDDFINGALGQGYSLQLSNKVYDLILEFANYGFNKSHSVAYGLVAYELAYLKANYPLYFYKALLNGVIGAQSKTYDYLAECQNIKQKVKGLDINESGATYLIKNNEIILPLSIIKDLGSIAVNKILEERKKGPFNDFVSCVLRLTRANVESGIIENLIYAGAFDGFEYNRHSMIEALPNVLMYANAHKVEISLMSDFDDSPIIRQLGEDKLIMAEEEKRVLGFYFSFNPIMEIKKQYHIQSKSLYELSLSNGYCVGFGLINRVKSLKTKKGDMMAFVDIVDDRGNLSLAVMPSVYQIWETNLIKGKYVYFEGNIDKPSSCLVKKMNIY